MRWGSFDPFFTADSFWQDRMGMPVANKEFLLAMLEHGTFDSYHFFCDDTHHIKQFQKALDQCLPKDLLRRVKASTQAFFLNEVGDSPVDVMHHGDFVAFMPYLMELRNYLAPAAAFAVTGVTHALDTVKLHTSFQQLLLSRPRPYDAIVCTSKCAVDMLTKAFDHIRRAFKDIYKAELPEPPGLYQVPLGIPEEMFQPQDRLRCRAQLGIPAHHFVMLSLGRFSPRRKADLAPFLECVAWLKTRRVGDCQLPEFTLVLAGAGRAPDFKLVQDMVNRLGLQREVRIEGNVSVEKKRLLYAAADIFLSLVDNYQETFGLSIIEAMAQGLPVVASDFDGYKDLVVHERTGFLIPTCVSVSQEPWESLSGLLNFTMLRFYRAQKVAFDLERLALAILTLASHPNLRREMGLRARTRAMSYQWPLVIPRYEELWLHLKEVADAWRAGGGSAEVASRMLIPSTEEYFSHYPSCRLRPETRVALSGYGLERCQADFRPIVYEEMAPLLREEYLNFLTKCLANRSWTIAELLAYCQKELQACRETVLVQFDWLIKHGYVRAVENTAGANSELGRH